MENFSNRTYTLGPQLHRRNGESRYHFLEGDEISVRGLKIIRERLPNVLGKEFMKLPLTYRIVLQGYQLYNNALQLEQKKLGVKLHNKLHPQSTKKIANWDIATQNEEVRAIHMLYTGSTYTRVHYNGDKEENIRHLKLRMRQLRGSGGKLPAVFSKAQFTLEEIISLFEEEGMELHRDKKTKENHVEISRFALFPEAYRTPHFYNNIAPVQLGTEDGMSIYSLLEKVHDHHSFSPDDMASARYYGYKNKGSVVQVVSYRKPYRLPFRELQNPYLTILSDGGTDPAFAGRHLMSDSVSFVLRQIHKREPNTIVIGDTESRNDAIRTILTNREFIQVGEPTLWVVGEPKRKAQWKIA